MRIGDTISLALAAVTLLGVVRSPLDTGQSSESPPKGAAVRFSTAFHGDQERIHALVALLLTENEEQRQEAQRELLTLARQSRAQRGEVIRVLLQDVANRHELDGRNVVLTRTFDYWFSISKIFGELKATEAIDALVNCIYCSNGHTGSFEVKPAFDALENMSALAVPRLAVALMNSRNDYAREQIALCLGTIGGANARKALMRALKRERVDAVVRSIKIGLRTIDEDRRVRRGR